MISTKTLVLFFMSVNLTALLVVAYSYFSFQSMLPQQVAVNPSTQTSEGLITSPKLMFHSGPKFDNPQLAYQILKELDVYSELSAEHYSMKSGAQPKFEKAFFGLTNEDDYCDRRLQTIVNDTKVIFEKMSFITDSDESTLLREILSRDLRGQDAVPDLGLGKRAKSIPPETNLFLTSNSLYEGKEFGKHFSCLSQVSNSLPGHAAYDTVEGMAASIAKYNKKFVNKPECFGFNQKYFRQTWNLDNTKECKDFFRILNSTEYAQQKKEREGGVVYVRKVASTGPAAEVGTETPLTKKEEQKLLKLYKNGAQCGNVTSSYFMQKAIHNPLLIRGHQYDIRAYVFMPSSNPLIVYEHDGFLRRRSTGKSDVEEESVKLFTTAKEEKTEFILRNYTDLQAHLMQEGRVKDPNWVDNYLRVEIRKLLVHFSRAIREFIGKRSSAYELRGIDFRLDEDLNLWFLDVNDGQMEVRTPEEMQFAVKMLRDHLEIVVNMMKSRMKRVINYVNRLVHERDGVIVKKDGIEIKEIQKKRKEFGEIIKNYFEPEFEPKDGNGFRKVVDNNFFSFQRYSFLIEKDCYF